MKRTLITILAIAFLAFNSVSAQGTFKITDAKTSMGGENVPAGSTVEMLYTSFSYQLGKPAQATSQAAITLTSDGGARYTSRLTLPNEYYISTDGQAMMDYGWDNHIDTDGTYTLTIPAGTYKAEDGSVNEAFTATWTIKKRVVNPFSIIEVYNHGVQSGDEVRYLDMKFRVEGANPITHCDGSRIDVYKGSAAQGKIANWQYNADGTCDIIFTTWNTGVEDGEDVGSTFTAGEYSLRFSEGAFTDADGNPSKASTFSWTVKSTVSEKASTPVLTVKDGILTCKSVTPGATYQCSITTPTIDGKTIDLSALQLSVVAKADKFLDSDPATIPLTSLGGQSSATGDINGDGKVTIADVQALVDMLMKK